MGRFARRLWQANTYIHWTEITDISLFSNMNLEKSSRTTKTFFPIYVQNCQASVGTRQKQIIVMFNMLENRLTNKHKYRKEYSAWQKVAIVRAYLVNIWKALVFWPSQFLAKICTLELACHSIVCST